MEKSFISVLLDFNIKLDKAITTIADKDTNKLLRIFVGLKNAAEFFGKLDTICNNIMLKNTQDDGVREQFAYNSIKGRAQKATASHSLWENVCNMNESDGLPHTVAMELCIPYQDLLKYQAFQLYPNTLVDELKELLQTSMEGFVWAPVNPSVAKERIEFLDDTTITESFPTNIAITRKFTQVGNPGTIVVEMTDGTSTTAADGYVKMTDGTDNGIDVKLDKATLSITWDARFAAKL